LARIVAGGPRASRNVNGAQVAEAAIAGHCPADLDAVLLSLCSRTAWMSGAAASASSNGPTGHRMRHVRAASFLKTACLSWWAAHRCSRCGPI